MMRLVTIVLASVVVVLAGCAGRGPIGDLQIHPEIQRVAVVSLAVSDYDDTVKSGAVGDADVTLLMQEAANRMLDDTETQLSKHFQVIKASSYADGQGYRQQALKKPRKLVVPQMRQRKLAVFSEGDSALKYGDIPPLKAQLLCEALGVDGVILVYSEWTVKIGGWVPLTKALTRNYLALWDVHGEKVFFRRVDKMGNRTLGAWGVNALVPETINQWTDSYSQSLELMLE